MPRNHLPLFVEKMNRAGLPEVVINTFTHYYHQILSGDSGMIHEKDIRPVASQELADADELQEYAQSGKNYFPAAVRITLNGGLGTSMGLTGAKSLLVVKNGKTFLDYIVAQAGISGVTLAFMNSFSTQTETREALDGMSVAKPPITFLQHKYPKILRDSLEPARWPQDPDKEWNPPGHGDVYLALYTSGTLQTLLDQGIQYAFISNSDNLGANLHPALLGYFADSGYPFMMEVARKSASDVKGGHLARHSDGRLILRESAQCPEQDMQAFQDIARHRFFNTNNIWVNLHYLKTMIEQQRAITLPMILNPKTLDPRDDNSPKVFQVETAMGAAISLFEGAAAVRVPRSRFFPVKKCSDLLAVRSDLFVESKAQTLMINPERSSANLSETVPIELDARYYKHIDQFEKRFGQGVPSLVHCSGLNIAGDVHFGRDVKIVGRVSITNPGSGPATVHSGSVVEKDLVF